MKRFNHYGIVAVAMLLLAGAAVRGEPLNLSHVPADATWVAHVDITAAINSQYGQLALNDMQSPMLERRLGALKNLLGLDPLKDFDSITAFGQTLGDREGTLIVQMGPDIGKLEQIAKLASQYQRSQYKDYVIHSWIDTNKGRRRDPMNLAGHRVYCGVMPLSGAGKTLLIFSPDDSKVKASIDRITSGNGAANADTFTGRPTPGSIIFIAAKNVDQLVAGQPNRPAPLRNIKQLACNIGETDGNAYLSLSARAIDAEQAANMQQMAVGLLAMVKMSGDPAAKPIIDLASKVNVTATDDIVNVSVQYPSKQLYELVKQLKAEHAKRQSNQAAPDDAH